MHDMARGYIDAVDHDCHIALKVTRKCRSAKGSDKIDRGGKVIGATVVIIGVRAAAVIYGFMKIPGTVKQRLTAYTLIASAVDIEISIIPVVSVICHFDINLYLVAAVVGCLHRLDQVNLFDALVAVDLELVVIAIEDIRGSTLVEFAEAGGYVPAFGIVGGSDADRRAARKSALDLNGSHLSEADIR